MGGFLLLMTTELEIRGPKAELFLQKSGITTKSGSEGFLLGSFPDQRGNYESAIGQIELGFRRANLDQSNPIVCFRSSSRILRGPRGNRDERQVSVNKLGIGKQQLTDGVEIFVRTDAFSSEEKVIFDE